MVENLADGIFAFPESFAAGTGCAFIASADVNGDGKPDLVVPNLGSDDVSILINESFFCELDGEGPDCNGNGIHDGCDILVGSPVDCNDNGLLDECEISADPELDGDGNGILDECEDNCHPDTGEEIDVVDLIEVIVHWGPCPGETTPCAGDMNCDDVVDVSDLLAVLLEWSA